jgi:hypothetical protein
MMRTALTLAVLLVAPNGVLGQGGVAGPLPTVDGYRLGDTWQAVGRLIPCRSGPNGLNEFDKVYAGAYYPELTIDHVRFCEPSDSVGLHFYQDTLFRINIRFPLRNGTATAYWNRTRGWAVRTLGEPDSVVASSMVGTDFVTAHWTNPKRQWQAQLQFASGIVEGGTLHLAHCKFLPAVCEVLFSPRSWR